MMNKKIVAVSIVASIVFSGLLSSVDAAKKKPSVQEVSLKKFSDKQKTEDAELILKQIKTEKVNKRVSSKLSYAEQTAPQIKAPYYRITYTFALKNNSQILADMSFGTWSFTDATGNSRDEHNREDIDGYVYTTAHSGFIRPGKSKRVSFVVLTKNKKLNKLPVGLDYDGFIAMNKETNEYTHGKPISVSFEGDPNDN